MVQKLGSGRESIENDIPQLQNPEIVMVNLTTTKIVWIKALCITPANITFDVMSVKRLRVGRWH
jgi:hypothetical protein